MERGKKNEGRYEERGERGESGERSERIERSERSERSERRGESRDSKGAECRVTGTRDFGKMLWKAPGSTRWLGGPCRGESSVQPNNLRRMGSRVQRNSALSIVQSIGCIASGSFPHTGETKRNLYTTEAD